MSIAILLAIAIDEYLLGNTPNLDGLPSAILTYRVSRLERMHSSEQLLLSGEYSS